MFGFLRRGRRNREAERAAQHELAIAALDHLYRCYRAMNIVDRNINDRVWTDAYLLGFGQGSLAIMIDCLGAGLTTEQKGLVVLNAFKGIAPDRYSEISDRIADLFEQRETKFMRGMLHGTNVAALILERPGPALLAEPEVQAALRAAPSMASLGLGGDPSSLSAAGAWLMHEYLSHHRQAAGYRQA